MPEHKSLLFSNGAGRQQRNRRHVRVWGGVKARGHARDWACTFNGAAYLRTYNAFTDVIVLSVSRELGDLPSESIVKLTSSPSWL